MKKKKRKKHPQKPSNKKEANAAEDDTAKRGLRAAIVHALSSGWVQNSGVGFVFALIALIVAMAMNSQIKAAAITVALAGIAALSIMVLAVIKHLAVQNPPFSVAIEAACVAKTRDATQIFCEYNQKYISPVPIALFIRVVNNQDIPSNISQLKIEVELEKRRWLSSTWLKTISVNEHMPLIWLNPPPTPPRRLSLLGEWLQPILQSRALSPHETVRGWVLLDAPAAYDSSISPILFRISVKDTSGHSIASLDAGPTGEENVFADHGWNITDEIDIGGFTRKHLAGDSLLNSIAMRLRLPALSCEIVRFTRPTAKGR